MANPAAIPVFVLLVVLRLDANAILGPTQQVLMGTRVEHLNFWTPLYATNVTHTEIAVTYSEANQYKQ